MADVSQQTAPGAWPYGKSKGSASEVPATQDKGVQQPEVKENLEDKPISLKDEGESQLPAQSEAGEKATDAPKQAKSVQESAPAKDHETVTNGGFTHAEDVKSRMTNGDVPEDEGKDMTEPEELQRQQSEQPQESAKEAPEEPEQPEKEQEEEEKPEDEKASTTSKLSSFAKGATNIATSLPGSKKENEADVASQQETEVPDVIKQAQEATGDNTELTPPGEGSQAAEEEPKEAEDLKEVEPEPIPEAEQAKTEATSEPENTPETTEQAKTEITEEPEKLTEEAEEKTEEAVPEEAKTEQEAPTEAEKDAEVPALEGETAPEDALKEGEPAASEAEKTGEEAEAGTTAPEEEGTTAEEEAPPLDYSILKGCKVNKGGNVVNEKGEAIGRIVQGILPHLIGRKVDEDGIIWNDNGKQIGKAEPIPENELQDMQEAKPFESFEGNAIDGKGFVIWNGEQVGKVIEGDLKVLRGKTVDADGEVLDKSGNVIGKAERWEPEPEAEPEPEPEVDRSILAGKRVNKMGNIVDSSGTIFGRVVEGDPKRMVGRMCNKNGDILSESGDIIGKAEVVPEGEREGVKEGPFAELSGLTVTRDGKVVTPGGDVVGRVIKGDPKILAGRPVDEDGDILDKNGNSLGKAERWEEPEVEKTKGPMAGLHVNREGNVVDKEGNLIGKLTSGDPNICSGKEIDDDGDVINSKGQTVGHVNLISEIPEPEPEGESEEEKQKREELERDRKLAAQMSVCLEQCLDKIKPICKMITEKIDKAERTPEDERDEEALVREVRPLIEEGGKILQEAHGIIRGLDPDGRIQANAKHKSATREASGEEYHLADVLKEITGEVTQCIESAKRKLEDMPHAKKELNPLWGLLSEPLFQIIAAVGLLLNGVLSLVGRLLSGLGLGGLVDNLLGGLGLTRVLESLGLGSAIGALTGKNQKKKK
ncbi:Late embryogenesis abundant protein [Pleurostoma richardsiae]|uniref:Late embryogenesis abundant protein n=1 Tax=Pleurostoma richardsiae TaxID=41990 RepID=A0AA38RI57_9PEZI|nr:Late embryogenesis abundant protein [Pleurostoma richardsiae]